VGRIFFTWSAFRQEFASAFRCNQGNLSVVRNEKEAERILGKGEIKVDGKARRDPKYPVGLMDVVEIPKMGESWRVLFDRKGYLCFNEIDEEESDFKLEKVVGKVPFEGGKNQLALSDGKTIVGDFESVNLGDTVKVSLPDLSVEERIPCEVGNVAFTIGGGNVGRMGQVKEISEMAGPSSDQIMIEADGEEFQAPDKYVFIVGKDSSEISLLEGC